MQFPNKLKRLVQIGAKLSLRSKRSWPTRTKFRPHEEAFAFKPREKWGKSKKVEGAGWGRGRKGTLACKPLNFEKPVHPQMGLLIGAAWLF